MLDKIVLSSDRKTATVVCDEITYSLYHSEGEASLIALINEFVFEPIERRARCEEDTDVIDLQLNLFDQAG